MRTRLVCVALFAVLTVGGCASGESAPDPAKSPAPAVVDDAGIADPAATVADVDAVLEDVNTVVSDIDTDLAELDDLSDDLAELDGVTGTD